MAELPQTRPSRALTYRLFDSCRAETSREAAAELASFATAPPVLAATGLRTFLFPVHDGWTRPLGCRAAPRDPRSPVRFGFAAHGGVHRGWRAFLTAPQAAAHAGYAIRAETGRDCILTVTRNLVCHPDRVEWVAFACARSLSPGDRVEANAVIPLDQDLQGMAAGYLAGTTPAAVMLDYLADRGPTEFAERFGLLAGRFV